MKKWHIIVAASVVFVALVVTGLSLTYRYVIVPRYIEPFAQKASEKLKDDRILDALYDQAAKLHNDGVLEDDIYSGFIVAYNRHNRDDEEFISDVLGDDDINDALADVKANTKRASYASTKVGIDLIQTNDDASDGKANSSYSGSRNSNRTKAEDIVEAEKLRAGLSDDSSSTEEPTESPEEAEERAWKKLMDNMTASEANKFRSIMNKLDRSILRSYSDGSDMEGLKAYLHANLDDDEYKDLVNMGYKYMNLFM